MSDHKQRFLFPDCDIRGELVQLESSIARILEPHDYPMAVQGLIGEAVAAVALLTSSLEFRGKLALQAQGHGPVSLLLAECTHDGGIRALARHRGAEACQGSSINELIGDGTMVITIMPEQGKQYQGIVPLQGESLADCLQAYFEQSEQLPTRLWLAAGNNRAAGLLLQRLPNQLAGSDANSQMWQHLETLAATLTLEELLGLGTDTILYRLFHDTPPQLPPASDVSFSCTCSRERTQQALLSLGQQELESLLDEDGEVTLTCDFCLSEQYFDAVDLAAFIHQLKNA